MVPRRRLGGFNHAAEVSHTLYLWRNAPRARNQRHSLKIHAEQGRFQPALSRVPRNTGGPLGSRFGEPPAGSSVTTSSPVPANKRAFSGETAMRLRPDVGKRPS